MLDNPNTSLPPDFDAEIAAALATLGRLKAAVADHRRTSVNAGC